MRVLITGAAGFIGSNLFIRCVDEGWNVRGVDDLSNGHLELLPEAVRRSVLVADFASPDVLSVVGAGEFDVVFHLAALPRVSYSVEHPLETNDVNVTRSLRLIDACRGKVKRFVFASSSSVYGGADELPTPETAPVQPRSPYALQKATIEGYLGLYAEHHGLDSACLRFFNVFGPNQLGGSPYSTAVSAWLTAVKLGQPLRSDGSGTQSRDMCYVDNVTHACVLAAKARGTLGARAFNVACGQRVTNKDILDQVITRYPGTQVVQAPWRSGDVMHTQADISRARTELGYQPLVGPWEGLERTIRWYDKEWDRVSVLGARV